MPELILKSDVAVGHPTSKFTIVFYNYKEIKKKGLKFFLQGKKTAAVF